MKRLGITIIALMSATLSQANMLEDLGQKLKGTKYYMPAQYALGLKDRLVGFVLCNTCLHNYNYEKIKIANSPAPVVSEYTRKMIDEYFAILSENLVELQKKLDASGQQNSQDKPEPIKFKVHCWIIS